MDYSGEGLAVVAGNSSNRSCQLEPRCAPIGGSDGEATREPVVTDLLHCQILGSAARTVILLHGLFGLSANLGPLGRELARHFRVLVPDLRNHGRSFHRPGMSYPAMAADVLALMDAHGLASAALVGHSMGGKVAMQAALGHPARIERILVGDIAPIDYVPHHVRLFAALREAAVDTLADRRATQRILQSHIDEPGVVALMLMNRAQREDGSWHWRFDLDAIEQGYADILAAPRAEAPYEGPALFLKGELSDYIPPAANAPTRALFPQARLKVIAGAGHWLHAEKPAVFLRLARDFLLPAA
jgi:esterase